MVTLDAILNLKRTKTRVLFTAVLQWHALYKDVVMVKNLMFHNCLMEFLSSECFFLSLLYFIPSRPRSHSYKKLNMARATLTN